MTKWILATFSILNAFWSDFNGVCWESDDLDEILMALKGCWWTLKGPSNIIMVNNLSMSAVLASGWLMQEYPLPSSNQQNMAAIFYHMTPGIQWCPFFFCGSLPSTSTTSWFATTRFARIRCFPKNFPSFQIFIFQLSICFLHCSPHPVWTSASRLTQRFSNGFDVVTYYNIDI